MSDSWISTNSTPSYTPTQSLPPNEETPLMHSTQRRRKSDLPIWSALISILMFIVSAIIITICGLCLRGNIASEKQQWRQELVERRMDEQSRISQWELTFNATREQHCRQVEKWEQELMEHRQDEQSRIYKWELAFNATRERNRHQMEKWQQEEEKMQSLGLYWGEPTRHPNCAGYNTREYWARLLNTVPFDYNWLKPCEDIPIVIHGRSVKTFRCYTNPTVSGEVYGHWLVDFDEPLCTPFWEQFEDKGCIAEGSGRRRFLAHLVNFHDEEDGEKLCASTPIDFHGKHFDHPQTCVNWGKTGIYGFWEIEDPNC